MKKIWIILAVLSMNITFPVQAKASDKSIQLENRTQEEIRLKAKELQFALSSDALYDIPPKNGPDYQAGQVKTKDLQDGLNLINLYRYVAGFPADIELKDDYNELAQYGAVLASNTSISDNLQKPIDMPQDFYDKGYLGIIHSNLIHGYKNICDGLKIAMFDSDANNISTLMHRRWLLNPSFKYTGIGMSQDIMVNYVQDNSRTNSIDYDYVAWPASNTPFELLADSENRGTAFSVSLNSQKYDNPIYDQVKIIVKDNNTGETYEISKEHEEYDLYIDNENYGSDNVISFRFKELESNDSFNISISGLTSNGVTTSIEYPVQIFTMNVDQEPSENHFSYKKVNNEITITEYTGPGGYVSIPDTIEGLPVTYIDKTTFRANKRITEVKLPKNLKEIAKYQFVYCSGLNTVIIPEGVTQIGVVAFLGCINLNEILIPKSVQSIEEAFGDNLKLEKITILNDSIKLSDKEFQSISPNAVMVCGPNSIAEAYAKKHKLAIKYYQQAEKIVLNPTSLTITKGKTYTMQNFVTPQDAVVQNITYKTTNQKVAKIDKNGVLTAVGEGKTYVIATTNNGASAKCLVSVVDPLKINPTNATISIGKEFVAKISNHTDVIWRSTSPTVATVDQNGKVKGIKEGYTYIVAKVGNGKEIKCLVKVVAVLPTAVKMNISSTTLSIGKSFTARATVAPSNATNKSVTYSSTNNNVAKVDASGKVTTIGAGTCYINAKTSNGKMGQIKVTVLPNPTSVSISPKSATVSVGRTFKATSIVTPSNAVKNVTYSSSSPTIATVDANGNVKAIKAGYTYISVKTHNGKTARFLLRVV